MSRIIERISQVSFLVVGPLVTGAETFRQILNRPSSLRGIRYTGSNTYEKPAEIKGPRTPIAPELIREWKPIRVFHFEIRVKDSRYEEGFVIKSLKLIVTLTDMLVDRGTSRELRTENYHTGSAGIMGALVVMAAFPITFPIMKLNDWQRDRLETKVGMSRHMHALLEAVRSQLNEEETGFLTTAFQNTWKRDQYLVSEISREDAVEMLKESHLSVDQCFAGFPKQSGPMYQQWRWMNGDLLVAHLELHIEPDGTETPFRTDEVELRVLGTTFTGEDMRELREIYKSKHVEKLDEEPYRDLAKDLSRTRETSNFHRERRCHETRQRHRRRLIDRTRNT